MILAGVGGLAVGAVVAGVLATALFFVTDKGYDDVIVARHDAIEDPTAAPALADCLDEWPEDVDFTGRDDVVACDGPHLSEVIGIVSMPDVEVPPHGDNLTFFVDDACRLAFDDYIGEDYDDSDLWFDAVPPTADAWAAGDRSLYCLLESDGYRAGHGTARGSAT